MKTLIDEVLTPAKLAAEIEVMTDRNDHTGAVCLLADFVGGKYPKIAAAIRTIHDAEGHMPYEVGKYRFELKNEMMFHLSEKLPIEQYSKLKAAF